MNPIKEIINQTGRAAYKLLEAELKDVLTSPTLYSLINEDGIPKKTQWDTVEKVAKALGYEIVFKKINK